jgi:hypothetical protein
MIILQTSWSSWFKPIGARLRISGGEGMARDALIQEAEYPQ